MIRTKQGDRLPVEKPLAFPRCLPSVSSESLSRPRQKTRVNSAKRNARTGPLLFGPDQIPVLPSLPEGPWRRELALAPCRERSDDMRPAGERRGGHPGPRLPSLRAPGASRKGPSTRSLRGRAGDRQNAGAPRRGTRGSWRSRRRPGVSGKSRADSPEGAHSFRRMGVRSSS